MSKELGSKKKFGSRGKKKKDWRVCFCDFTRRRCHYDDSITKLTGVKRE